MYLYEDAGKPYRFKLFEKEMALTYSSLCENFEKNGENIFKEPMNLANYKEFNEDLKDTNNRESEMQGKSIMQSINSDKDNNYDKVEEVNAPKIAAEKNSQDI